ncbi:MAG TPA: hypothetical protein VFL54_09040, partial [Gammaproteobacteria bacterium]|nr:hypothetical protein [Gammaproteobacteria bacterium]
MAVSKADKEQCQAEMARLLERYGTNYDWTELRAKYPSVSKPTFYRWLKKLHDSGVPAQNALRKARKQVRRAEKRAEKRTGSKEPAKEKMARQLHDQLPVAPSVDDLCRVSMPELIGCIKECIDDAQRLKRHAQATDGDKIRNAKLYLNASEQLRKCVETATRLSETMY